MELSESSPVPSSPPLDQPQESSNPTIITNQLDALSISTQLDNNNGDSNGAQLEDRQNQEEKNKEADDGKDKVTNLIENEGEIEIEKDKEFEEANDKGDENEGDIEEEKEKEFEGVERNRKIRFPVRDGAEDCSFYLRTGNCKFGMNCKFNHPPNRKSQYGKVRGKEDSLDSAAQKVVKEKDDSKTEQIDCKYFDRPGGCKFGKACKFNHNRKATAELNFMGLPIRPGEKECPYYMRNGSCKFGANCKFNHPDPMSLGGSDSRSGHSNGGSIMSPNASQSSPLGSWSPAALSDSPPYVPLMYAQTQAVPSQPEWHAYQAPVYSPERSTQLAPAYATKSQPRERNTYTHQQQLIVGDEFPERPGQPECTYFLKTGTCKYRSACKFHHPKNDGAKSTPFTLSESGLPLRPGHSVCSHYSRYGICKFGPACKYDHPVNYAHAAPLASAEAEDKASSASGGSANNDQHTADSPENDQAKLPASEIGSENPVHQSA